MDNERGRPSWSSCQQFHGRGNFNGASQHPGFSSVFHQCGMVYWYLLVPKPSKLCFVQFGSLFLADLPNLAPSFTHKLHTTPGSPFHLPNGDNQPSLMQPCQSWLVLVGAIGSQNCVLCNLGPFFLQIFLTQPHLPSKAQSNPWESFPFT